MKIYGAFKIIFVFLLLFSANTIAHAQCVPASTAAGALDTCFGGSGSVGTNVSMGRDTANAVLVQPDGKIVVAGTVGVNESNGTGADFGVVRYNTDGSLDTTFDGDGKVRTNFGGIRNDYATAIALQADGKIVVAGYSDSGGGRADFAVVRYNSDGSLDTTFDGDGKVLTDVGSDTDDKIHAILIQPDGKIFAVGGIFTAGSDPAGGVIVRYNSNGSLDTSFDGDGKMTLSGSYMFYAAALQPDGKIIAAGTNVNLAVARFNANGPVDTSFGTSGVATYTAFNFGDRAYAVALEPNGKIVAGGYSRVQASGGYFCAPMVRFTTAGNVETSSVNCNEAPGSMTITGLALQPNGKIVASGTASGGNAYRGFLILRYNHALSLDYPFNNGEGGVHVVFTVDFSRLAGATAVALQSDNKIIAVGWNVHHSGLEPQTAFLTVRLHAGIVAPHRPSTLFDFEGDGKSDVSAFRPSTNNWYVFQSSNAQVTEQIFGLSGDIILPADFDGDGKTDLGIFRPSSGDWWFKSSITGVFNTAHWGQAGDIPRPSDFDGDGKADYIVFRPSNNTWYRFGSSVGAVAPAQFGLAGDKPLVGDFDDDGRSDLAIFRPSTGDWWWQSSNDNIQRATHWGISTDIPAPGDYDGDGKTDFAVYRPSTGVWYIINSSNFSFTILNFGLAEDKPVPADYDGDGKTDIAVFRPSTGVWYQLRSTAGFGAMQFGVSTDIPVPNAYIP
jgi:uncharacterized delta-60 repeat protein